MKKIVGKIIGSKPDNDKNFISQYFKKFVIAVLDTAILPDVRDLDLENF